MEHKELEIPITHYHPNNCNLDQSIPSSVAVSEQSESLVVTSTQKMEPELPQIESVYKLNNEELLTTSEALQQMVEPELVQFKSVYSKYTAANDKDFSTSEANTTLNNEQSTAASITLTQIMETKLPQIQMVFSEYDEYSDGNFEKFKDTAISSSDQYQLPTQVMDTDLAKIDTVYPKCNLSNATAFSDFKVAVNSQIYFREDTTQLEPTKIDQSQIEMLCSDQSVFSNLETILNPNNEEIVIQTLKNVQVENKIACSDEKLQSCEKNNNSSPTQAVNVELPQITEVYSEHSLSSDKLVELISTVSKSQTDEMEISKSNLVNKICDKLNKAPIQEAATSSEEIVNTEVWKPIAIKKEIIGEEEELILDDEDELIFDDDSTTSESCLNLNKNIKSEFQIKSEEVDVKDEERNPERRFECKKCKLYFKLECSYRLHVIGHNSTKPHMCDECTFKCSKKKKMLAHLRSHTGEKKIPCKICNEYYYFFNVVEHFQKCPKPKRYYCDECEYGTNQKFYYERHVRLHTGERLKCSRCDLGFLDNVARKKHYKCHTKEKPYQCHICYRRFKLRGARERHILAYCDRRCPKCDYISIYCTDFYEHVKAVHPSTKLKLSLQKFYRQYEKVLAVNYNNKNTFEIEREYGNYETGQNIEMNLPSTEVVKYETSQNIGYNKEQNVSCETEQNSIKVNRNTDYELIQNIKYEFIEGTENLGYNTNYESIDLGADYDYKLMQNIKLDLTESVYKQNIECVEVQENFDYDLIQNVNCELTEGRCLYRVFPDCDTRRCAQPKFSNIKTILQLQTPVGLELLILMFRCLDYTGVSPDF